VSTPRYASGTDVSSGRSKEEIERTLVRYGAAQFMSGWDRTQAVVGFMIHGRQTHTPEKQFERTAKQASDAYEQAIKQRWRALALVIKAKLEAVEAGIVTFEDEFAMHMILPDGKSVREHVLPAIEQAYSDGDISFLAITA
jgi:hypothetical protein